MLYLYLILIKLIILLSVVLPVSNFHVGGFKTAVHGVQGGVEMVKNLLQECNYYI